MGKVKLTQEQADGIESWKKTSYRLEDFITYKKMFDGVYKPLRKFTLDKFAQALYIGYEVEPEFKVWDWVTYNNWATDDEESKFIGNLVHSSCKDKFRVDTTKYEVPQSIPFSYLRHATPEEIAAEKQRRWWAKHDRDVHEFRKNDLVSYRCNSWGGICVVSSNVYDKDAFKNRLVRLYNHRLDRSISIKASDLVVISFVEDRKDVANAK